MQRHSSKSTPLDSSAASDVYKRQTIAGTSRLLYKITIIIGNDNPENILSANQYQNQIPEIEIIGIDHAKMLPHVEKSDEFIEIVKPLLEK